MAKTSDYKGLGYLRRKLVVKRSRVLLRYQYYDMKHIVKDLGISTPPGLASWFSCLGWCAKGVDALADRLVFRGFRDDYFDLNGVYNANNPDILADSAVKSALISSCSFIYISKGDDGFPRFQVLDGGSATGIIDPITGLLKEGYAVLERDDMLGTPTLEAYFTAESTRYIQKGKFFDRVDKNPTGYPLLVPVIFRPDAKRPFGHSRISRACMSTVNSALRTIKRSEIAAEFFAYPQKYVTNLSNDFTDLEVWKAAMSSMMMFTKDEDGDHPMPGQFQQQSMEPHLEQLKMFASLFAGEMGLTLDDMGFSTGNPASVDAIKAAHDNLRLTARAAQRSFGTGLLNAGFVAACLRDDYQYRRAQVYQSKALWEPLFEPDASMLGAIGDGAMKINQAVPGYFGPNNLRDMTGVEAENYDGGYGAKPAGGSADDLFTGIPEE